MKFNRIMYLHSNQYTRRIRLSKPLWLAVVFLTLTPLGTHAAFKQSITADQIRERYAQGTVNILIVPGHQPTEGGTAFNSVYERELVVPIADRLAEFLSQNPRFQVLVARTGEVWHPVLNAYFETRASAIQAFIRTQLKEMNRQVSRGSILPQADQVAHNTASAAAALQLYGLNRFANDYGYDIALHIHLNDYGGRPAGEVGAYDGFTIYIPDHQYSNGEASRAVAEAIARRLNTFHATSTLPIENKGVVEDQDLIAIGSNNTAKNAALLIEYGYIYEPQIQNPATRETALADYAYQTYLGLQDFFHDPVEAAPGTVSLPHSFIGVSARADSAGPGVYALQSALRLLGSYPAGGESLSNCPVSGKAGPCTTAAIRAYQRRHGLEPTGQLGPQTRRILLQELARAGISVGYTAGL
jgi:N-acetylmuramoyl-L-alanine amidase